MKSILSLQKLLASGALSSVELTKAYLLKIKQSEPVIGAFLTVCEEQALIEAKSADARLWGNRKTNTPYPALLGIPGALKDNICTKGVATTCASRLLEGFVPPYSATAAEKLTLAGSPLLGKLNMDEFAMGASTETSFFQKTKNPLDPRLVPGGSSGGSAAAVAAGEAPYSLGSDTGGSIRQPAAFCGVTGMKPTYGRVSRFGLVAFASSLDQIGPLTKTVAENALVLEAIAGHDPKDATSVPNGDRSFSAGLDAGIQGLRIGLISELFSKSMAHPSVASGILAAASVLERAGAHLCETSLPLANGALAAYYLLSSAEASSNLARFDGIRYGRRAEPKEGETADWEALYQNSRSEGFGPEVQRRIMVGTFALSAGYYDAYYAKAVAMRRRLKKEMAALFDEFDVLLCPAAPTKAFPLGGGPTEKERYAGDACTIPASLAGLPALSIPCAYDGQGLPCGMQLIGPAFSEALLYRVGRAFERESGLVKEES